MAKKKNSNRKALQIKGKYGKKSIFYGKSEEDIESIKKRKRDKRAEQAANKERRRQGKRRRARNQDNTTTNTGPTPTSTDFKFEMPDVQGMLDTQANSFSNQLDALREDNRLAAEERRRLADEAERQFELDQRTMLGNEARAGQQTEYKFGSISGRKRGGTFGFRRRKRRLMGGIGAVNSLAAGAASGMLNF